MPAPRPPPTRKNEIVSAWISVLIVGGSYAVLLPMAVYVAPLAVPALAIPALRAKALNPKSSLMGYLIWGGLSAWAIAYVLDLIDPNGSVGKMLAGMAVSASLPLVISHWAAFRRLRRGAMASSASSE
jgi:hypothetical protein